MTPEQPERPTEASAEQTRVRIPFPASFVYSNVSAMAASMMDIRISFAEVNQERVVETRVGVTMPPEHAAQLTLNLMTQLVFFEESFGHIRHPVWRAFREQIRDFKVPEMNPETMPSAGPQSPITEGQ